MVAKEHYSKKRVAILETLRSTKIHPTAEWVYSELKPIYKDLSLGTVYRNIKKFCADGLVKSVGVFEGQEHFDGNVHDHSHFICTECGCIVDIEQTFLSDDQKQKIMSRYGFNIANQDVVFKGQCRSCVEKN